MTGLKLLTFADETGVVEEDRKRKRRGYRSEKEGSRKSSDARVVTAAAAQHHMDCISGKSTGGLIWKTYVVKGKKEEKN